jgi:hypothetical protein
MAAALLFWQTTDLLHLWNYTRPLIVNLNSDEVLGKSSLTISAKPGWSWGCVSAIDSNERTIWIADAHRNDGKRFVVRANEKLTALILPFAYLGALP